MKGTLEGELGELTLSPATNLLPDGPQLFKLWDEDHFSTSQSSSLVDQKRELVGKGIKNKAGMKVWPVLKHISVNLSQVD